MENDDFYDLARLCHQDRLAEEERKRHDITYVGELQYSLFCCWCNAYKAVIVAGTKGTIDMDSMKTKVYNNVRLFQEYVNEIDGKFKTCIPDVILKKYILKKYFGYDLIVNENGECFAKKETE